MAIAGLLQPAFGTLVAASLVIPAIIVGGWGLPVPRTSFHIPRLRLHPRQVAHLARHGGPNAAAVVGHIHRLRLADLSKLGTVFKSGFGLVLGSWFFFSVGISSFSSLYPVLMLRSFAVGVAASSIHPSSPAVPVFVAFELFQRIWPLLSVASNDLAVELAPIGEGTAMGLLNAAAAAAWAIGAIAGGAVADQFGYESVNIFAAAGALLSLLCVLPLRNAKAARQHKLKL